MKKSKTAEAVSSVVSPPGDSHKLDIPIQSHGMSNREIDGRYQKAESDYK
jgi:hypothetical protein